MFILISKSYAFLGKLEMCPYDRDATHFPYMSQNLKFSDGQIDKGKSKCLPHSLKWGHKKWPLFKLNNLPLLKAALSPSPWFQTYVHFHLC